MSYDEEVEEVFENDVDETSGRMKEEVVEDVGIYLKKKEPSRPTWIGVIAIALVFSLTFGAGAAFVGYQAGVNSKETLVINNPEPSVEMTSGDVYYSGVIDVANKVGPAVVSISVETLVAQSDPYGGFFGRRSQPQYSTRVAAGSGVIIDNPWTEDGTYIVTNNHVVEGKQARIMVTLKDNREFQATLVGTDEMSDLAVLKIDAAELPYAELGDSSKLKVGEPVVAIGNPYEFDHTVTTGVISANERIVDMEYVEETPSYGGDMFGFGFGGTSQQVKSKTLWGVVQTDAAINPGNSGGPLVTLDGKVVGINTFKREGDNLGFAISSDIVKRVAEDLIKYGRISWPYIGIAGGTFTQSIADDIELDYLPGVIVAEVAYGPARDADIQTKDVITKIGDYEVKSMEELLVATRKYRVGDEVDLEIVRNGKKITKTVKLAAYPDTTLN